MKLRVAASLALAASLAIGLSACNFVSPQRTLEKYDPSDGVGANLGDVDVRNAMLISEDGTRGTLVISVTNPTADQKQIRIEYPSFSSEASNGRVSFQLGIPGQQIVTTSTDGENPIVLEDIDAPPGSLFPIYMQSGSAPGVEVRVPVLDGTLGEYVPLLPSPSPTPTPTPTPTVTATPTPAATPSEGTASEGTVSEESTDN